MEAGITRRSLLLSALPVGVAAADVISRKAPLPPAQLGEFVRLLDPSTETPVIRLTTPAYTNLLPSPRNRFVASKPRLFVFSSDRYGRLAPHQADLRTGIIKMVAETSHLDPASLVLDEPNHHVYYLDGPNLLRSELAASHGRNRTETLAEGVTSFCLGAAPAEFFLLKSGRLMRLSEGRETLLAEEALGPCEAKPGDAGCLFWRKTADGRDLWYAPSTPGLGKPVRIASGAISNPCWSSSGEIVLLLRDVPKSGVSIAELHEVTLNGEERSIASTSQFVAFSPNSDDTVFVGASRSKAQPNVILLLRSTQRELTLCEHHSSQPASVRPVFSPNSQRVYFQSDREGKPAIYSVNVEQLVEPT